MMPGHHIPLWETTDEDRIVPVRIAGSAKEVSGRSRMPAAVIGMIVTAAAGMALLFGWNGLTAELLETEQAVRLTDDGADPQSVTMARGQSVTWVNETGIPHILSFETFADAEGEIVTSPAIFPEGNWSLTIPESAEPGTYPYASQTSPLIQGEIVVSEQMEQLSDPSPQPSPLGRGSSEEDEIAAFVNSIPEFGSEDEEEAGAVSSFETSLNSFAPPQDDTENAQDGTLQDDTESAQGDTAFTSDTGDSAFPLPVNRNTDANRFANADGGASLHGSANDPSPPTFTPRPNTQPTTGMEGWATALIVVIAFLVVARRAGNGSTVKQ